MKSFFTSNINSIFRPGGYIFFGWWIVAISSLIQFLGTLLWVQAYGAYAVIFQSEFGWSMTIISGAFAMIKIVSGLLGPLQGWLVDKYGPRLILTFGNVLFGLGFLVLSLDLIFRPTQKNLLGYFSALGLFVILVILIIFFKGKSTEIYSGILVFDDYSHFFRSFFLVIGIFIVLMSTDFVSKQIEHVGEFYAIILFSLAGMSLMAASAELLMAYISLELLSFGLYVLVAFDRYNKESNEAGLKLILLGAFSSAILLFGISQIYGLLGTTMFSGIQESLRSIVSFEPGLVIGIVLLGQVQIHLAQKR